MSTFQATLCSGRGKATDRLRSHAEKIGLVLGRAPIPGSLNLVLDRPVTLDLAKRVLGTEDGRSFWPATVAGIPVLIYRYRKCPLHVLEIVSDLPLRRHLGLGDGGKVEVDLGGTTVPTPLVPRLCWTMFWKGHETDYFLTDRFRRIDKKFRALARLAYQEL